MTLNKLSQLFVGLIAVCVIYLSYSSSFRLTGFEGNPTVHRWLIGLLAGLALGASNSIIVKDVSLLNHLRYYSVMMFALFTFFMLQWLAAPFILAFIASALVAIVWCVCCAFILKTRPVQTLIATLLLLVSFFASVVVFLFVALQEGGSAYFFNWLFGELNLVDIQSSMLLTFLSIVVLALIAMIGFNYYREESAWVLLGLSISALGAVFFIGVIAAYFAKSLSQLNREQLLFSSLIAATLILFPSEILRLWFGGYTPPLMLAAAIVVMPLVVLCQILSSRFAMQSDQSSRALRIAEYVVLMVFVTVTIVVVWHLNQFAQTAI